MKNIEFEPSTRTKRSTRWGCPYKNSCSKFSIEPYPPRLTIWLDNPERAVKSIRKHIDQEVMAELVELLKEVSTG
jgi:hypothetical protein